MKQQQHCVLKTQGLKYVVRHVKGVFTIFLQRLWHNQFINVIVRARPGTVVVLACHQGQRSRIPSARGRVGAEARDQRPEAGGEVPEDRITRSSWGVPTARLSLNTYKG